MGDVGDALRLAYASGSRAFNAGQYADAVEHFKSCIILGAKLNGASPGDERTMTVLRTLLAEAEKKAATAFPGPPEAVPGEPVDLAGAGEPHELAGAEQLLNDGLQAFADRNHGRARRSLTRGAKAAPFHWFVRLVLPFLLMHALQHTCHYGQISQWVPQLESTLEYTAACINDGECDESGRSLVVSPQAVAAANPYIVLTSPVIFQRPALLLDFLRSREALKPRPVQPPPGSFLPALNAVHDGTLRLGYITGVPSAHVTYELVGLLPLLHAADVALTWYLLHPGDVGLLKDVGWWRRATLVDLSGLSPENAAARVRQDGVHVLVDLDAHIEVSSAKPETVLRHAPAAAICQWLGWAGTSGASHTHYAGLDRIIAPPAHASHFAEHLVVLPHTYQANNHALKWQAPVLQQPGPTERKRHLDDVLVPRTDGASVTLAAAGPQEALVPKLVGCSFNQLFKLSEEIFTAWTNLLRRLPHVAIVQGAGVSVGRKVSDSEGPVNLHALATSQGADAPARLRFTKPLQKGEHLSRMVALCDVALDTVLYNSHTTGADALWSATPLVTVMGQSMASRVAHSLSAAAGLPDTRVFSYKEYEDFAAHLFGS